MDCSIAADQHLHLNSVNCLDQSNKSLKQFTADVGGANSTGSTLNNFADKTEPAASVAVAAAVKFRKYSDRCLFGAEGNGKSHTYRISMANLEETQESELDVILGELSLLEAQINSGDANFLASTVTPEAPTDGGHVQLLSSTILSEATVPTTRTHSRTNSTISGATISEVGSSSSSGGSENGLLSGSSSGSGAQREPRTESPDNDSAFSDTVSLLSSESSASSNASSALHHKQLQQQQHEQRHYMQHQLNASTLNSSKAAKIQLALHKLEHASIRRLFVKAFTSDGASKSLLVDERMTCGHVTRLLADKNHIQMQPHWALVENLGDLQMERLFEDHELVVDNLMNWNSDAGNRVLFQQRSDKVALFAKPEIYLPGPQMAPGSHHDEHTRTMLLEEFFESNSQLQVDGPLYMKADSKKGWKRYHFVLRSSGLYYFPKEKTKSSRDLVCLTLFNGHNVYRGLGWKKKWKAPTDYTFGFKSDVDSSLGKACRTLKMLCAEDLETLEKWVNAIRISKYGKTLWEQHKSLMEDLCMGDTVSNSSFAVSMRSESISSISSAVPSQCGSVSSAISSMSNSSSGRISRASSSSSSGCLSDDNNGFDSEFTTGTIKRKPSMKPNLPLTTMTRQLKEVGEITICEVSAENTNDAASPERSGTLTRRHSRRKSQESNGSGTLKRRPPLAAAAKRGSAESMNTSACGGGNSSGSSNSTPTPTPSICSKPLLEYEPKSAVAAPPPLPLSFMTSSTLSLDSLPPPPPPQMADEHEMYGSQLSLVSLPPPPPPEEVLAYVGSGVAPVQPVAAHPAPILPHYSSLSKVHGPPPAVPAKPIRLAVKAAPPYKAPPEYAVQSTTTPAPVAPGTIATHKKVSFADSPVLLRRKMCSPEPRSPSTPTHHPPLCYSVVGLLLPPPRGDKSRQSATSSVDFGSPKRLQESASNPPRDFLKDLQRVMRKKWQVAQKCKLEPATTPHEVLGFRDFSSDELLAHNLNAAANGINTHYYRETANVSNWVQEHYGAGAPTPPAPLPNEYALYENVHAQNDASAVDGVLIMEPQFPIGLPGQHQQLLLASQRKKRPPPPPPKRSDSTQLTHRV